MDNLTIWNDLRQVPKEAKKTIQAGRLKGMTDIKPQWRLKIMTEKFGAIGIGWYYEPVKMWTESYGSEISAHVQVNLYIKDGDNWSMPISGTGGSMLIANEKIKDYEASLYDTKFKPYHSDEAYKMATTDALSVAMKQLGVAADVYMGLSDSKYDKPSDNSSQAHSDVPAITNKQKSIFKDYMAKLTKISDSKAMSALSVHMNNKCLTEFEAEKIIADIKKYLGE